ncbi:hypothetical protein TGP89_216580 [Toxoplasma gondii p89]|uniref:Uncharacterized protein n=1 Tax=Toxoplasma gondii p89 TaxID=943119 RepID=A0A086JHJ5_TOXGO|nr:hypothetical protein TGP89_216580 [Toxoplasma gondii p89]
MRLREGAPAAGGAGEGVAPLPFNAGLPHFPPSAPFPASADASSFPPPPLFSSSFSSVPGAAPALHARGPAAPQRAPPAPEGAFVGEKLSRLHALRARLQKSASSAPGSAPPPASLAGAPVSIAPASEAGGGPALVSSIGGSEDSPHTLLETSVHAGSRVSPPRDIFVAQPALRAWSPGSGVSLPVSAGGPGDSPGVGGGGPSQPQRDGRLKPPPSLVAQAKRPKEAGVGGQREDLPKAPGVTAKAAPVVPPPAVGVRAPRPGGDKLRVLGMANKKPLVGGLLPAPTAASGLPQDVSSVKTPVVLPSPALAAPQSPPLSASALPTACKTDLRQLVVSQVANAQTRVAGLEAKAREGEGAALGVSGKAVPGGERGFQKKGIVPAIPAAAHATKAHAPKALAVAGKSSAGAVAPLARQSTVGPEAAATPSPPLAHTTGPAAGGQEKGTETGKSGKDFDAPAPFEELMRRKREAQMAERQQSSTASLASSRSASQGGRVATGGGAETRKPTAAPLANSSLTTLAATDGGAGSRAARQASSSPSVTGGVQTQDRGRGGDSVSGKISPKVPPCLGGKLRSLSPLETEPGAPGAQTLPVAAVPLVASAQGEKKTGLRDLEGQEAHAAEGEKSALAPSAVAGTVEADSATAASSPSLFVSLEQGQRGPEIHAPASAQPQDSKRDLGRDPQQGPCGEGTATKNGTRDVSLAAARGALSPAAALASPPHHGAGTSAGRQAPSEPPSAAPLLRTGGTAGGTQGRGLVARPAGAKAVGLAVNREGLLKTPNPAQGMPQASAGALLATPTQRVVPAGGVASQSPALGAFQSPGGIEGMRKSPPSAVPAGTGKAVAPTQASVTVSRPPHPVQARSTSAAIQQTKAPQTNKVLPVAGKTTPPGQAAAMASSGVVAKQLPHAPPQRANSAPLPGVPSAGLSPGQRPVGATQQTRQIAAGGAKACSKAPATSQANAGRVQVPLVAQVGVVPQAGTQQGGGTRQMSGSGAPSTPVVSAKSAGTLPQAKTAVQMTGKGQAVATGEQGHAPARAQVACVLKNKVLNDYCRQLGTDLEVYRSLASDVWPASADLAASPSLATGLAETLDLMSGYSDRDLRERLLDLDRASSPCGASAAASGSGSAGALVARSVIEEILGPFLACALECSATEAATAPKDALVPFASMTYEELKEGGVAAALGQSLADVLLPPEGVDFSDASQLPQAVARLAAWTDEMEKRLTSWGNEFTKTTGKRPFSKVESSLASLQASSLPGAPLETTPVQTSSVPAPSGQASSQLPASSAASGVPSATKAVIRGGAATSGVQRQGEGPGQDNKRLKVGAVSVQGQ